MPDQVRTSCQPEEENGAKSSTDKFFDKWDEDESGLLDVDEVLQGVEKLCDRMNLDFDSRRVSSMFDRLDEDGNQELDRKEFSSFLKKFMQEHGLEIEDVAYHMADALTLKENICANQRRSSATAFFRTVFATVAFQKQQEIKCTTNKNEESSEADDSFGTDESETSTTDDKTITGFFRRITARLATKDSAETAPDFDESEEEDSPLDAVQSLMWDVPIAVGQEDAFTEECY